MTAQANYCAPPKTILFSGKEESQRTKAESHRRRAEEEYAGGVTDLLTRAVCDPLRDLNPFTALKGQSVTPLHCETSQGKRFPVNSLFLRMRGFLRHGQKARGMGLSGEHVVEHPTVLTIFPVEFPDTGNFRQRRVRSRLAPPPYFPV